VAGGKRLVELDARWDYSTRAGADRDQVILLDRGIESD